MSLEYEMNQTMQLFLSLGILSEATADSQALKLLHEAQEFQDKPSLEEAADVLVCLAGWLAKSNLDMGDLTYALRVKRGVLLHRTWVKQSDGTFQHG